MGSFAAVWDDVLPPVPEAVWQANIAAVVEALGRAWPVRQRAVRCGRTGRAL